MKKILIGIILLTTLTFVLAGNGGYYRYIDYTNVNDSHRGGGGGSELGTYTVNVTNATTTSSVEIIKTNIGIVKKVIFQDFFLHQTECYIYGASISCVK